MGAIRYRSCGGWKILFHQLSYSTGKVLNCDEKGNVWCVIDYSKRRRWEKWQFIIPDAIVKKEMMRLIPFNTPVCLQGHTKNNLQNEFFWRTAKCNNRNMKAWEQMVIKKIDNGKFIIQSRWNNRNLQVQPNGRCIFENHNNLLWDLSSSVAILVSSCSVMPMVSCGVLINILIVVIGRCGISNSLTTWMSRT